MNIANCINFGAFRILSCIFVVVYLFGLLNNHFSDKNNYCAMTYMFEYPQFVRIAVDENKFFPQYGLYAYSEGRFTERARKMWFDGIPVLFLPGNSGSHMQVRSLASVALRKSLSNAYEYHFDYFTISYNEELSGLYGGVLQSQTEFAASCITKILSLYKSNSYTKSIPSSVVLIGHSMGGVIAKRLLAYPDTMNTTNVAITLAAPIESPVVNFDSVLSEYYMTMNWEWENNVRERKEVEETKFLISIGSGPRDVLVPAALTASNYSHVGVLTTTIPGVWVSPDHVSMVWCKQLVMVINRFLFGIIDTGTRQITENQHKIAAKSKQYFVANRSMTLDPQARRNNVTMQPDGFWYEDNRRNYQIHRPAIGRTTHLMIRLVSFPQNRFVAIEGVNVDDKDWIFGCNAKNVHSSHRYCKEGTSLSELSRWIPAADNFGKRKLATIHLHSVMETHPDWTHVVVRVSPTKKPVTLNVDVSDHASRVVEVRLPIDYIFGKHEVTAETERNILYYELLFPEFNVIHQAFLLYVEPTSSCQDMEYHASAELQVPWAMNQEYTHFFTHIKQSPMKLRLFKSNPNLTQGLNEGESVKVTLLLDPKCTFQISVATSWYHRFGQFSRTYSPALVAYAAALVLLAARSSLVSLRERGYCTSPQAALTSEGVKPYYVLVFGRLASLVVMMTPLMNVFFENAGWKNYEIVYFTRSMVVLPLYMTALGILNILTAAIVVALIFSSQLAHRLLFRIVWRGGTSVAERVAAGLQKVPLLVSVALAGAVPLACGAAALAAGAAFYAFMISKMYEEYLEDYFYRFLAKIASRICRMFKAEKKDNKTTLNQPRPSRSKRSTSKDSDKDDTNVPETKKPKQPRHPFNTEFIDDDLNNINFHMILFFLWILVTVVNIPVLLTWARNFKYSMVLKSDTSYYTGLIMSACSAVIWQMDGPRKNLKNYENLSKLLFVMAVLFVALAPFSMSIVNYGVTFIFAIITLEQLLDVEDPNYVGFAFPPNMSHIRENAHQANAHQESVHQDIAHQESAHQGSAANEKNSATQAKNDQAQSSEDANTQQKNENIENEPSNENNENPNECDECNENRIYKIFKTLREKFSFSDSVEN